MPESIPSETDSIINNSNEIVLEFRQRRLFQVAVVAQVTIYLLLTLYLFIQKWDMVLPLIALSVLFSSIFFLIKTNHAELGISVFLTLITVVMVSFMWVFDGLKDEILLVYPVVLIFAVILGKQKLMVLLSIMAICNIFAIGYVNTTGVYVHQTSPSSLSGALIIIILLSLVGYSLWLLSSDLRELLIKVTAENKRVEISRARIEELLDNEKRLRQQEIEVHKLQRLENIGVLAGGIAHDFNNILTSVFGNISLALMKLDDDHPSIKYLKNSEQSIERASQLTGQLLTFAKGGEPQKEKINLNKLLEDTITFDLAGSNVKVKFKLSEDDRFIEADVGQLQQVISNLAINAVQAMQSGGTLTVSLDNAQQSDIQEHQLDNDEYVKITIADEGIGIDAETLKNIFVPYFTTKEGGNGLGLAIVHSIIKKHAGVIDIESHPDQGTNVNVLLPALKTKIADSVITENTVINSTSLNILVMDDDTAILSLVTELFEAHGATVSTAVNGYDMITKYQTAMQSSIPFDVVIMDLTIPGGMGGKQAIQQLLKIDKDARCLVASGYAEDPIMANFTEYGFKAAIPKPFNLEMLYNKVVAIAAKA